MKKQIRIAVVTGASSGMGKEFARQLGYFYKNLDEIWVIARRRERLETLRKQCRVPVRIFEGDLLKKQVYKEYHRALKAFCPDVRMIREKRQLYRYRRRGEEDPDRHGRSELPRPYAHDADDTAVDEQGKPDH